MGSLNIRVRNVDTDEKFWLKLYEDDPVPLLGSNFVPVESYESLHAKLETDPDTLALERATGVRRVGSVILGSTD